VPAALIKLGYSSDQVEAIVSHIDSTGTIEGAPGLKNEHLAVFDSVSGRRTGCGRSITWVI
jgi:ribonucleoside-diphosphate reductase alpha chain